jgi:hypothetical protein
MIYLTKQGEAKFKAFLAEKSKCYIKAVDEVEKARIFGCYLDDFYNKSMAIDYQCDVYFELSKFESVSGNPFIIEFDLEDWTI